MRNSCACLFNNGCRLVDSAHYLSAYEPTLKNINEIINSLITEVKYHITTGNNLHSSKDLYDRNKGTSSLASFPNVLIFELALVIGSEYCGG